MAEITIDVDADVAIWIQITNRIVFLIKSGEYKSGDRLPSVRELAVKLNINFNTVSKAYQSLERDGIICTKRGQGTFIADGMYDEEYNASPIDILIEELIKTADSCGMGTDELKFHFTQHLEKRGKS